VGTDEVVGLMVRKKHTDRDVGGPVIPDADELPRREIAEEREAAGLPPIVPDIGISPRPDHVPPDIGTGLFKPEKERKHRQQKKKKAKKRNIQLPANYDPGSTTFMNGRRGRRSHILLETDESGQNRTWCNFLTIFATASSPPSI